MNDERDEMGEMEALLVRYRPAGGVAAEAGRARLVRKARERASWAYWEAMAAVLLVGMALAQVAGSVTRMVPGPRGQDERVQEIVAALAEAGVPLDEEERAVLAAEWAAGERLIRVPVVRGTGNHGPQMGAVE
jgi:hypothetical protein